MNIFFDHGHKALIGDLGIAIPLSEVVFAPRCGTPRYRAPEYTNDKPYGTGADMWSFARVMQDCGLWDTRAETLLSTWEKLVPAWHWNMFKSTSHFFSSQRSNSIQCVLLMADTVAAVDRDLAKPSSSAGPQQLTAEDRLSPGTGGESAVIKTALRTGG